MLCSVNAHAALPAGTFTAYIKAAHSNKCLDLAGGSMSQGANIQQFECNSTKAQRITFNPVLGKANVYTLVIGASNQCVDVSGIAYNDGANIYQWNCHGGLNQQFKAVETNRGTVYFIAQHSGKVLDVSGGGTQNGTNIHQWTYGAGLNQEWVLESSEPNFPAGSFTATMQASHSGKCLDNYAGSTVIGNNIQQWSCNEGTPQKLTFDPVVGKSNVYTIKITATNMCVDVAGISNANGANIYQWICHGGLNQQFRAYKTLRNTVYLEALHSGKVIEVSGGAGHDGANIHQWEYVGVPHQEWHVVFMGPTSLKGVAPPEVPGLLWRDPSRSDILTPVVVDKQAAIALGKALFWDEAIGSDGMACASCHFQAGADSRVKNQVNPGFNHNNFFFGATKSGAPRSGPNYTLRLADFPLDPSNDDVVSSSGVFKRNYIGFDNTNNNDLCSSVADSVFNVGSINVRQVEPRNSPTTINAAYNFRNFWDGRANNLFNGSSPFGARDTSAGVWINYNGTMVKRPINLKNSSLASQAVGPVLSILEMSCVNRNFAQVGRKVLTRVPLDKQKISSSDSVLGNLAGLLGTGGNYATLVRKAFNAAYWNGSCPNCTASLAQAPYTQMEANFPLFFGLAVQMYEATLVSDDSKFDKWKSGSTSITAQELLGHDLFDGKAKCSACHKGPVLTNAAIIPANQQLIERMPVRNGATALYDTGFYNLGVVPNSYDISVGGVDPWNNPLSFSAQYKSGVFKDQFSVSPCRFDRPYSPDCNNTSAKAFDNLATNAAFKTPTLRNVALTGPYFHNGSKATLDQVVDLYNVGGHFDAFERHPDVVTLGLTASEKAALVAFLRTLTDERVAFDRAPFDHPSLHIPHGHVGNDWSVLNGNVVDSALAADEFLTLPAVGAAGLPTRRNEFYQLLN